MDAKITKERLVNALSYDWLKIVSACFAAVIAVIIIFTTASTKLTQAQTYNVYAYLSTHLGYDGNRLADNLKMGGIFSHETMQVTVETFNDPENGQTAYGLHRAAGQGDGMLISDYRTEGKSDLTEFLSGETGMLLLADSYLADTKEYLEGYFGDVETGTLNKAKAEEDFRTRVQGDKRYRSEEALKKGAEDDFKRLEKIRTNYQKVVSALKEGLISYNQMTFGETTYAVSFKLGGSNMANLTRLFYYEVSVKDEEGNEKFEQHSEEINFIVLNNGTSAGISKYESVNLLAYLIEKSKTV